MIKLITAKAGSMITHIIRKSIKNSDPDYAFHIKLQIDKTHDILIHKPNKNYSYWITQDMDSNGLSITSLFPALTIDEAIVLFMDQFKSARKNLIKEELIIHHMAKINYLQDYFISHGLIIDVLIHMKNLLFRTSY